MTAQQGRRWRSTKANDNNQGGEKQTRIQADDDKHTHKMLAWWGTNKGVPKMRSGVLSHCVDCLVSIVCIIDHLTSIELLNCN